MSYLLTLLCKLTKVSHLRQLHAHLIHNSLHCHSYWVSLLITHCTRLHAQPSYTRLVFDSAAWPSILVFNSMLKYFSQLGSQDEVLSLFKCMLCGGNVRPDGFVYPVVVKAAGKDSVVFHAQILKLGHNNDRYTHNVMLDMYAKNGPIEAARKLFDEKTEKTIVDWNTMISGYWKWGIESEACTLFNFMAEKNIITWTSMVSGYAKLKDLVSARRYFDEMPVKSVESWNAMLSGYAQNGFVKEALGLFDDMCNAGVQPNETTWATIISSCASYGDPNVVDSLVKMLDEKGVKLNYFSKTSLLVMYAKSGNLDTARRIFDELGSNKSSVTWNAMISAYTRFGHLDLARKLFDEMPKRDVASWNSMIAGYAQNGQSTISIELFREMISTNKSKPDELTMVSVISACGHLGALELGNWVANLTTEYNIKLTVSVCNSLIFMYSKCGSMTNALRIFQEMKMRDVVSYNTLIAGFAAHGQGREALKLIPMMKEEQIEPDRVTFIGILTACSHAGLLEEGQKIFELIKSPSVDHYACMVDLLGRVGQLDEAKRLIDSMPMEPHSGVYGALLNASRIHKRIDYGELAANKLFEIEPTNLGNYVLLSNSFALAGRWDDVIKVREMMRRGGLRKKTGWSWMEYDGKVHKFIIGDRTHPRSDDIYRLLAELSDKMRRHGYTADKSCVLRDVEEEDKEEMVGTHSEKLAICFALLVCEIGTVIRVVKNLRICNDCHTAIKIISKLEEREIIVRDNNRFHHFVDGLCSCNDYW